MGTGTGWSSYLKKDKCLRFSLDINQFYSEDNMESRFALGTFEITLLTALSLYLLLSDYMYMTYSHHF